MAVATRTVPRRPPLWRDVRVLRFFFQALFLLAIAVFLYFLYINLVFNLRRLGIRTDFGYVDQAAGFAIPDSDFRSSQSLWDALKVGTANTATVSLLGIVLATIIGVVVGVARLSTNWLVRRGAALFVESLRNVPVLVIILFWYLGVLLRLPPIGDAVDVQLFVVSNRGLVGPGVVSTGDLGLYLAFAGVGLVLAALVGWWRTRRFDVTGEPHHRLLWGGGVALAFLVVGFFLLGRPFAVSLPEPGELATEGGFRMSPEYAALLIALAVYTASHIAEIVRGAILAVAKGQTEAASALGLTTFQRLRFVVLPQAFRIAIPPTANQYLNLVKNSSLGVAIAYPEVTRITRISISQNAPAPQAIIVLMLIYLAFSLTIALITNLINRRLAITAR